jgi:hypothetical protein
MKRQLRWVRMAPPIVDDLFIPLVAAYGGQVPG